MPRTALPIANGFYRSDSLPVSAQDCINCYPVIEQSQALAAETVRGTPGVSLVVDTTGGACRGAHLLAGVPYFVMGDTLYRLNADNTSTAISGTITGSGPVSMAQNGVQLCILVPGGDGFIYTVSGGLVEITDTDFTANGNPQSVVFLDGYFVFTTDENKVIISNLNNGLAYGALDFGSVESSPDDVVGPVVYRNQLFVGGARTTEAFSNVGGAGFPFSRINLFLEQGFSSQFAVQTALNSFLFIGAGENEQPGVWISSGNGTEKISTHPVDEILRPLTSAQISAITSWSYSQNGHYFVGWNLPETSIVFDLVTGRWHERKSRIPLGGNEYTVGPWRARYPVSAYGKILVGDSESGKIGALDPEAYLELGNTIARQITTQPFQNNMGPFFVPWIELTVESGVGDTTTTDPMVTMSRSRDGGRTFQGSRPRPIGAQGEYSRRAIWRRNGRVDRYDVYRFNFSDPVKFVAAQLTAEIEAGDL